MVVELDMKTLHTQPKLPPKSQLLPTISQISQFLSSILPVRPRDVNFIYHSPHYRPSRESKEQIPQSDTRILPSDTTPVARLVFAITPTPGVYSALFSSASTSSPLFIPTLSTSPLLSPAAVTRASPAAAFLHRPFTLDRRRVPRGSFALSSHTAFDEVLTVGYNTVLASRIGVDLASSVCLQGYKGDPGRKIGIVGCLDGFEVVGHVMERIKREFGVWDSVHGVSNAGEEGGERVDSIKVVAIMNAFHPDEVLRVLEAAYTSGWITDPNDGSAILYLTGQAREPGLAFALDKGMKVVCVGHRTCEEWGIGFLAAETKKAFPALEVVEVYEDEEPLPPRPKKDKKEGVQPKTKKLKLAGVLPLPKDVV